MHAQGKYLNIKPRKIIRCEALLRGLRGEAEATAERRSGRSGAC
nr:hypothetical protein [Methanophagales archaeon]